MIDFRYHLVSLISVFIALAVGIILGAGPLQNSIGERLSAEVDSLRAANSALKSENESLTIRNSGQARAWEAAAPTLVGNTLKDMNVSIAVLPGVKDDIVKKTRDVLTAAGAAVNGTVQITENWTALGENGEREQLARQIQTVLPEAAAVKDANGKISLALLKLLKGGIKSPEEKPLYDIFGSSDVQVADFSQAGANKADGLVILAPDVPDNPPSKDHPRNARQAKQQDMNTKMFSALISAAGEQMPAVLSGNADSQNDLVLVARTARLNISTADAIEPALAMVNIPLALAADFQGKTVSYGLADGVDAVIGEHTEAGKNASASVQ